uniref:Serpin domain-containing protein n=1 Tax=Panagrolaimus davidi TaxID=227884 RepID=A0A914Q2J0_9BILA
MMSTESELQFYQNHEFQVVTLPYENPQNVMCIIIPRERFGLQTLLQNMASEKLSQLLFIKKDNAKVNIELLRFKIKSSFELVSLLKKLGIVDAFGNDADFSGIFENNGINISDVLHKAFIETNEEGSEASAATATNFSLSAMPPSKTETITVIADHPFFYAILDVYHQTILFMGTFYNEFH